MIRAGNAGVLAATLLVLTVVVGFLGGVAWQRGRAAPPRSPGSGEEGSHDREDRRLVIDEVGLEPAKRAEVEEVVQHFLARMRALEKEFEQAYRPRQRELYRTARDSIKSILPLEQRALYDSLLEVRYRGRGHGHDSSQRREAGRPAKRGEN